MQQNNPLGTEPKNAGMPPQPYISPATILPEITLRGIVLASILSAVLAAANAYLGLFAGMTVSASIPASVISMAMLRVLGKSNILENNGIQTAASSGEALAAGAIFTFPALILMHYWTDFNYWETTLICFCGGTLGVLFTIPLRNALIVKENLKFPEGVATAEVLQVGTHGGGFLKYLLWGSLAGGFSKLAEAGFQLWQSTFARASFVGNKIYASFSLTSSAALMAVGYIVGFNISLLVFLGGVISWYIAIPIYITMHPPTIGISNWVEYGSEIWNAQIRYLGAGAMLTGGLWALIGIRKSLISSLKQGVDAFKQGATTNYSELLRTEKDIPVKYIIIGIFVLIIPIMGVYWQETTMFSIALFMTLLMVGAGFLFSAVAGYMAGLVGSSNNPISGVTIATLLVASVLLVAFMGTGSVTGPAAAILIGAVVCCAASIAGDNMQDLKSGHILGATPYKQQIMQLVGVWAAAFVLAPVLSLLNTAYGFGAKTPLHPQALSAPQATLMQSVAQGVFGGSLPWNMILLGAILGAVIIAIDEYQRSRNATFRVPVLAVAVGVYLPFELDSTVMLGGVVALLIEKYIKNNQHKNADKKNEATQNANQAGLLFASGLITGEALIGIFLAIPIAITSKSTIFALIENPLDSSVGVAVILLIAAALYSLAIQAYKKT